MFGLQGHALFRDALQWVGAPVLESGISTIVVAIPLVFTITLVLQRFAVIIGVSMATSLFFTFLFNLPLLGLLGPTYSSMHKEIDGNSSWFTRAVHYGWLESSLNRASVCCALILAVIAVVPSGWNLLQRELWLPILLIVLIALPFCRFGWRRVRRFSSDRT